MKNTEVWIGKLEVRPQPGNDVLGAAKGAFVNVLALASSKAEYEQLVEGTMVEYGFFLVGCADVAALHEWKRTNRVHPSLQELATSLNAESPIQFDEFQSYRDDDA